MTTDKLLEALRLTRDDYDQERIHHRFLLDAYAGTGGFQGAVRQTDRGYWGWAAEAYGEESLAKWLHESKTGIFTYLDRFPREDQEKFRARTQIAHFINYVEPIADIFVSSVNKRRPVYEGIPQPLLDWMEDVDGAQTTWAEMMDEIIRPRAALLGWLPVLLDRPALPVGPDGESLALTRAQEADAGLRTRALPLFPANLLDWQCDESGRFRWAKLRLEYSERRLEGKSHPLGELVMVEEFRLLWPDRSEIFVFERGRNGSPVLRQSREVTHSYGEVPIVIFRAKKTQDDPVRGISLIHNVAIENRRHFNLVSELDNILRGQTFATLVIPTKDRSKVGEIIAGTENAFVIDPESARGYEYIAPPNGPTESYEKRIERTVEEIYRIARVEYTRGPKGNAASGIAHAYEYEATNRRLADFAGQCARGEAWVFQLIANELGAESLYAKSSITAPTDFRVEDIATDIKVALDALGLGLPPSAEAALRRRVVERLLPGLPSGEIEEIEDELDRQKADALNAEAQIADSLEAAAGAPVDSTPEAGEDEGEDEDEDEDEDEEGARR